MASMCSLQLVRVRGLPYEVQVPPIDPVQRCHLPGHLAFGRSSSFFPSGKFSVQNVRSPRLWDQGCVSTQGVLKVRCAINQPISMGLTQPKEMAVVLLKVASVLCARATKVIYDSQLFLQCAPAVGLMIFAMWGLGPLLRVIHHLVLQKEDRHWKGSQTYYIMNSYLRPFMLWIGVIAVCRAFDPVVLSTEASQAIKQRFLNFVRSLSTVLAFASCAASLTQQLQKLMVEGQDKHDSRRVGAQFIGNAVYTAIWIAAVCLFMELLGFSTQKWLTAGGLGTVLLTLAGREIFTNFLSGVMIHATRPFVENEWIQTKIEGYEVSGTVEHVGWWSPTIIRGDDREAVHIPNHKFTVSVVRNLSQKTHWRIKTHFGISHLDVSKITNIVSDMRKVLAKHPQVEQKRLHRRVFFDNINPENQALLILVSCFVKTSHFEEYLRVKEIILLDLLKVINHHHARLATPIRSVQRISEDSDSRHSSFRDMSSRSAEASPYLLIEATSIASGQREVEQSTNGIYGVSNNKEGFEAGKLESEAGTSTTAGENDNAAESNSNLKSQVKQKEHVSSEVRPRSGATSTEAAYLSATTKPQLEGLDSMGLNSKDITLLGAAFEKPPAKIPEGPVDSGPYVDIPQGDKAVSRAPADPLSQAAGAKVVARSSTDQFPQVGGAKVVSRSVDELSQAAAAEADKLSSTVDGIDATLSGEKEKEKKGAKEDTMGVEMTVQNRTEGDLWMDTRRPSSHGTSASLAPSSPKQEKDRLPPGINSVSRPQLEDNLVLGVALDGPKRTLRLDDAAVPPSEKKTLVTSRNGNVNTAVKDRQDSAQSTSPTAAPSDVRDRDR